MNEDGWIYEKGALMHQKDRKKRPQLLDYDVYSLDILRHYNPQNGSPDDYLVYYGPEKIMFFAPRTAPSTQQSVIHIPGQPQPGATQTKIDELLILAVGWWWMPINFTKPGYTKHFVGNMAFQITYLDQDSIDLRHRGSATDIPDDYNDALKASLAKLLTGLHPSIQALLPDPEESLTDEDGGPPPGVIVV